MMDFLLGAVFGIVIVPVWQRVVAPKLRAAGKASPTAATPAPGSTNATGPASAEQDGDA